MFMKYSVLKDVCMLALPMLKRCGMFVCFHVSSVDLHLNMFVHAHDFVCVYPLAQQYVTYTVPAFIRILCVHCVLVYIRTYLYASVFSPEIISGKLNLYICTCVYPLAQQYVTYTVPAFIRILCVHCVLVYIRTYLYASVFSPEIISGKLNLYICTCIYVCTCMRTSSGFYVSDGKGATLGMVPPTLQIKLCSLHFCE